MLWGRQRGVVHCELAHIGFELVAALARDLIALPGQLIRWRDIAKGAVETRR